MGDQMQFPSRLGRLLQSHAELRYALIASPDGGILGEAGSRADLTCPAFADYIVEPDTLRRLYALVLDVEQRNDARFIPQGYAQGDCHAVLGRTPSGELFVGIGLMPPGILAGPAETRARWIYGFQKRTWNAVTSLFAAA